MQTSDSKNLNMNSKEAYSELVSDHSSCMLDVRTPEELRKYGMPNVERYFHIPLLLLPNMEYNTRFTDDFLDLEIDFDTKIFVICDAGVRSLKAIEIIKQLGFENCINVYDGTACKDTTRHGWSTSDLPWKTL